MVSVNVLLQPADEPLTIAEAKAACRVDADFTQDDDYIFGLISTARTFVEKSFSRAMVSRTLLFSWDRFPRYSQQAGLQYSSEGLIDARIPVTESTAKYWPDRATFRIPVNPLQAVTSFKYTDSSNTLQTLDTSLYRVDYTSDPARIAPAYAQIWPLIIQQTEAVTCQAVVGYGPVTSIAAAITVTGSQAVTPGSMYGIYAQNTSTDPLYPGTQLAIGTGTNREIVTVTAATASTFTATFQKTHSAGVTVGPGIPAFMRTHLHLLIAHWYRNREAVTPGQYQSLPMAAESLGYMAWNGEYT